MNTTSAIADRIESVDSHRNGIAGLRFVVAIINDPDAGRVLYTDFDNEDEGGFDGVPVSVLRVSDIAAGNIFMYPQNDTPESGWAAWRGDRFAATYRQPVREALNKKFEDAKGL